MTRVPAAEARSVVEAVLAPYGPDRGRVARALVDAHRRGWPEFGLPLLDRELAGPARGRAPLAASGTGAVRSLDARGVPGPVALAAAVRTAGELSRDTGVALVAARSVTGTGRLAPYVAAQAGAGRVALVMAHGPRAVAPHGGHDPVLGTNPLAFALPRAAGRVLVADFATAALTQAGLARHRRRGTELPPGAACDAAGRETRDPEAVHALLPAGGPAGTLTGLLAEAVAGALLGQRDGRPGRGLVAVVVVPSALGADEGLAGRVEELCRELAAAGGHVPGTRAPDRDEDAPIAVPDGAWSRLSAVAGAGRS